MRPTCTPDLPADRRRGVVHPSAAMVAVAQGVSLSYQHRGLLCDIVGLAAGSAGSAGTFLIVEERDYIGHELG
jgi:hypothetical protein